MALLTMLEITRSVLIIVNQSISILELAKLEEHKINNKRRTGFPVLFFILKN